MSIVVKTQTLNRDNEDTLTQSIYYQHYLINTKRLNVYVWSSYDLYWLNETGMSIALTIPYKRGKRKKSYKVK